MHDELTLTAAWIFPVDAPPIERGSIAIRGETIVAVDPVGVRTADVDLGQAAIVPGFVNAHTHLDLSCWSPAFRRSSPDVSQPPEDRLKAGLQRDFTAWLRDVIAHRRQQTVDDVRRAIAAGIRESLAHGVTAIGDISAGGVSWDQLADSPLDAVVYHEAIGLGVERAAASFQQVRDWFESRPPLPHCRPGISPHAPYSVGAGLLESLVEFRREKYAAGIDVPLATHLAETREELELLTRRTGPFVDFLKSLGVYDETSLTTDWETWLAVPDATFVHANYADPLLMARAKPRAVVYCPRTHAAFGHDPYPLREYLDAGIPVALGTDSLASNPDLSILREARFVRQTFPDLPGETVLRMATLNGARSLGGDLARRIGSLTPGKDATLAVKHISYVRDADPHDLLFAGGEIERLMIRGKWIVGG